MEINRGQIFSGQHILEMTDSNGELHYLLSTLGGVI